MLVATPGRLVDVLERGRVGLDICRWVGVGVGVGVCLNVCVKDRQKRGEEKGEREWEKGRNR